MAKPLHLMLFILFLQSSVDAFVNRRRKTISESTIPDHLTVLNAHNYRASQPISIAMGPKNNTDSKK